MVKSELIDGIVWLTIEGEMESEEVKSELGKWLLQKDAFSGFITDMRKMTKIPSSAQQQELEEWRQKNKSGKPHALLGRTNALGVLAQMFVRMTRANDTRYFMNPEAAVEWIKEFDQ